MSNINREHRAAFLAGIYEYATFENGYAYIGSRRVPYQEITKQVIAGLFDDEISKGFLALTRLDEWIKNSKLIKNNTFRSLSYNPSKTSMTKEKLINTLMRYKGGRTKTARVLNLNGQDLNKMMKDWDLEKDFPTKAGPGLSKAADA